MTISIGVFGYLEVNSIVNVLLAMTEQKTHQGSEICEVIAVVDADPESKQKIFTLVNKNTYLPVIDSPSTVSSGRSNREVVQTRGAGKPKIKLSYSAKRVGKSAAINRFFREASGDILVMCDADNIIDDDQLISKLITPLLENPKVGIVGGHPVPYKNKKNNLVTFAGENLWAIHHQIASIDPKISGNLFAIRSELKTEIPFEIICDDTYLQYFIEKAGFRKAYQPQAHVGIKTPNNLHDYARQRIRIYLGYRQLKKILRQSAPSTTRVYWTMKMIFSRAKTVWEYFLAILTIILEGSIRLYCALYPINNKKQMYLWPMVKSTKF